MRMMNDNRPKVGVAVIVRRDNKVLMQIRKNIGGHGTWAFPGGHLELGESWEDCACRETLEEAGVSIKNIRFAGVTNDISEKEGTHYITVFMGADLESGEPKVMEPDKCERWEWHEWDKMPEPLFLPILNLLKKGYRPQ
jgi:8-oxo-dGTP diphosphatase